MGEASPDNLERGRAKGTILATMVSGGATTRSVVSDNVDNPDFRSVSLERLKGANDPPRFRSLGGSAKFVRPGSLIEL